MLIREVTEQKVYRLQGAISLWAVPDTASARGQVRQFLTGLVRLFQQLGGIKYGVSTQPAGQTGENKLPQAITFEYYSPYTHDILHKGDTIDGFITRHNGDLEGEVPDLKYNINSNITVASGMGERRGESFEDFRLRHSLPQLVRHLPNLK